MNFLEAMKKVQESNGKLWARPKGSVFYSGFTVDENGQWSDVPSDRGGEMALIPPPIVLFGEWEILTPKEMIEKGAK